MKRNKKPANSRPAARRRRGNLPVATTVLTAAALMGLCEYRLAAEEAAVQSPAAAALAQDASDQAPRDASTVSELGADRRLREGTQLTNCLGHFRQSGDAVAFIDENGRDIGGLPNLNLERITRMLKAVDEPESIWWSVSGTVTEFSGRNYVLITRAVYKAATPPPSPESLAPEAESAP